MTDSQIFQIIGLFMSAAGSGMLLNPEYFRKMLRDFAHSPATTFITGLLALVIGYLIASFHNIWEGATVVITIFGWLSLFKGLTLILFPDFSLDLAKGIVRHKENFTLAAIMCLAIGILFLYLGYAV